MKTNTFCVTNAGNGSGIGNTSSGIQSNNNVLSRSEQQMSTNKGNQNTYQTQDINGNDTTTSWRLSPANSGYVLKGSYFEFESILLIYIEL